LVEIYRPSIEHWVWRLFAEETLRLDHFAISEEADRPCILGKAGRAEYYRCYEHQARRWRKRMRRSARLWLARLQQDATLPAQPSSLADTFDDFDAGELFGGEP